MRASRTSPAIVLIAAALLAPEAIAQSLICLDAGHGGSDPGAVGVGGLEEAGVNLDIVLRIQALLEADTADTSCGGTWSVILTRSSDTDVSLAARSSYANSQNADRFVSIHCNAFDGSAHGTETFSYAEGTTGADMRCSIQGEVVAHLATTSRGCKTANFAVLRDTNMPATLTETAFIDHVADSQILDDPAKRQEAARAHLHALQQHFGITVCDPGSTTPPTWPLMTMDIEVDPVEGQAADFCTLGDSAAVLDLRVGQTPIYRIYVTNEGEAIAGGVAVGVWVESPYLEARHYDIYDNAHGATCGTQWCINDSNSRTDNPPHDNPGSSFILQVNSISPGESKMIELQVEAAAFSILGADHPDVRAWVYHIDDLYDKADFASAFMDACSCQTYNGGDLRVYHESDVYSDEICDGADNDCDGEIDEGACADDDAPIADEQGETVESADIVAEAIEGRGDADDESGHYHEVSLEGGCACALPR